jgi:antitoxin Phd
MNIWTLQEAKTHFRKLIHACKQKGPQIISMRGHQVAVVISKREYELLTGAKPSFLELMNHSPLKGLNLEFGRNKS